MSFLQHLQIGKQSLKKTKTIVTLADGRRYIEHHSSPRETLTPQSPTYGFVVDTSPDQTPAQITTHLYLGSQDCCAPDILLNYEIKHVLSIGIKPPHRDPTISYTYIECLDLPETNLSLILDQTNSLLRHEIQNGRNVLVHCNAGISRSASVVIGYLILETGLSYEDAFRRVKAVRAGAQPNTGFRKQLEKLSKS